MGTQISKTGETYKENEPDRGSLPSTPILTPKNRDTCDLDPRSPTANIVRTPIQLSNALNTTQTPIIGEINASFEIHTDEDTFENSAVKFDPRSPSVDFIRTPIVIEKSGVKLRNKNLDNVRKLTVEFSPVKKNGTELEQNGTLERQKGPILLESSPLIRKNESEKRISTIGLLETNLDFIETDLDQAQKDLLTTKLENCDEKCSEIENEIKIIEDTEQKLSQIEEEIKEVIEVTINPSSELDTSKMEVLVEQEVSKTPVKIEQKPIESESLVVDFDRKITNLIYEDQAVLLSSPKQNKLKDKNRTPLGDRNRNARPKSAASKLKVHDKPRNEYVVSKIPVFKDKKSNGQCENTPPPKKTESRLKKSQWDAEKTLII